MVSDVAREASGVGPVDAIFRAIAELTGTGSELIRYQVHAVTAGLDAQGEVSVTIEEAGRRVIGNGVHEDVMVASAKAYVHALNKLEWHKARRRGERAQGHLIGRKQGSHGRANRTPARRRDRARGDRAGAARARRGGQEVRHSSSSSRPS